ncbi:MAG TPA: hypothetical protein VNZ22_20310, partial [Bacillota bacterium]|nr:hypothetical protein [Bacillota bacterium]
FDQGNQGWNSTMQLRAVSATNGALTGISTGTDPAFFGPQIRLHAGEWTTVSLRMKLQAQDGRPFKDLAQLFWRSQREGESEATSARFEVAADGQWHDYQVPVAQNRHWRGVLTQLRLDPCNRPGVAIAVDYLRLVPSQAARQ